VLEIRQPTSISTLAPRVFEHRLIPGMVQTRIDGADTARPKVRIGGF
jgi:hypothetical protein